MNMNPVSNRNATGVDSAILMRQLVTFMLFVGTIVAAGYVLTTGNMVYMLGVVALPFVLMLMQKPTMMLVMALVLNATLLPVPGLKASMIGLLAELLFVGTFFLGVFMGKLPWKSEKTEVHTFIRLYLFLVILIVIVRGAGFRFMGSNSWGGTSYIYQFAAVFMFFALSGFRVTNKTIRWVIWGRLLAGAIGSFVLWKMGSRFSLSVDDVDQSRLSYLRPFVLTLLPVAIAVRYGKALWINVFLVVFCLGLIGLTGFRSFLVAAVLTVIGYGFFRARNKVAYIGGMILLGLLCWGAILAVSSKLPLGLQRAVSFIPFVQVDADVLEDASQSIEWRFEIWQYCIEQSHKYLLIGRGLTIEVIDILATTSMKDIGSASTWFRYGMHSYHSGPFTLLIDFGIPGLIIHLLFTCFAFKRVWGYASQMARMDTLEARYTLVMCVVLLWDLVSFYLVYGGAPRIASGIVAFAVVTVYAKSVLANEEKKQSSQLAP